MTQKELAYFEDAIGHVGNIMKILEESIKNLEDERLISFMESEKEVHTKLKNTLMSKLEDKANG